MEYESLAKFLKGWFDKPLDQLPMEKRKRVESDFPRSPEFPAGRLWDALSNDQRRGVAEDWDLNHDPTLEAMRQIAWEEMVVGWNYWAGVPSLTAQEFLILRHGHDPRKFEAERNNTPGEQGKTLGELVSDDLRLIERDEAVKKAKAMEGWTIAKWVRWASAKGWGLPSFMTIASQSNQKATARADRQCAELQRKAEEVAKTLGARLKQIPARRDVAKQLATEVGMKAATVERRIRKTW